MNAEILCCETVFQSLFKCDAFAEDRQTFFSSFTNENFQQQKAALRIRHTQGWFNFI